MTAFTKYNNISKSILSKNKTSDSSEENKIPLATLFVVLSVFDSVVNFIVLVVYFKSKKLRQNSHHSLILCLSMSDFTMGISGIVAGLRVVFRQLSTQFEPCAIQVIVTYVSIMMSFMQTFLISLQRFLFTVSKRHAKLLDGKRKYVIYLISWLTAVVWCTVWLPSKNNSTTICNFDYLYRRNIRLMTVVFGAVNLTFFVLTLLLYLISLNNVRKRYMKTFAWQVDITSDQSSSANRLQLTELGKKKVYGALTTVGIITAFLFLLTGPIVTIMLLLAFGVELEKVPVAADISLCLATLNSTINPFIYACKIKDFREELRRCCI